jgi:hypothetical protein
MQMYKANSYIFQVYLYLKTYRMCVLIVNNRYIITYIDLKFISYPYKFCFEEKQESKLTKNPNLMSRPMILVFFKWISNSF